MDLTLEPFLVVLLASLVVMSLAWLYQYRTEKAEIVDVCWTFLIGASGVYFAVTLDGDVIRRIFILSSSVCWSFRLGLHILRERLLSGHRDGRYQDLRQNWGSRHQQKFFIFFIVQAFLVAFLSSAHYSAARNLSPIGWFDLIGIGFVIIALFGESISDRQLKEFKRDTNQRGMLCTIGLWRYSRHPNYFFEWLYWISFPFLSYTGSFWMLSFFAPSCMYYLVRYVTGVVPMEARMKLKYGAMYTRYQNTTSEFFLLPVRPMNK